MTKPFNELTDDEVLALNNEGLNDSIRLEAIRQGVAPPITLSQSLETSDYRGYQRPAQYIKVWRFARSYTRSDFGYLTEEQALSALDGMVAIESSGYPKSADKIIRDPVTIETLLIGVSPSDSKAAKFIEACTDESPEFISIRDQCIEKYGNVRQAAYDVRVNSEKRAEYIRLSGGDAEIAKRFWDMVEKSEWPETQAAIGG